MSGGECHNPSMWIFARKGFVSIVRHKSEPDSFLMRARTAEDLEAVLAVAGVDVRRIESPLADYRFRAFLSRDQLGQVMAALADTIDYTNFKSAVAADGADTARLHAYHTVWHAMQALQR